MVIHIVRKLFFVNAIKIGGTYDFEYIRDTITHEVDHYWKTKQKKGSLITNVYEKAKEYMFSKNYYLRTISQIIYISRKFEIDAAISGIFENAIYEWRKLIFVEFKDNSEFKRLLLNLKTIAFDIEKWELDDLYVLSAYRAFFPNRKLKNVKNIF